MNAMKKILVPTDFSKPAQAAVDTAIILAERTKAEVILLHVVDQPSPDSFNVEGEVSQLYNWEDKLFTMKLIEKSKKKLAQVAQLATNAGVQVRQELRLGNPFHGIRTVITDHQVDLVVMGTEGHSKLDKMLIGSNTEKVIRHASCPVLSIHRKPSVSSFRNIVYATSMIENEDKFSKVVAQLQELFDATLHVVWVNTPAIFQPDTVAKRTMKDFAKRLQLKNYTLNVFNDYSEEEGILQFADSINADLIAMATHGRKGLAHVLSGSIAEDVSSRARRPVLTSSIRQN